MKKILRRIVIVMIALIIGLCLGSLISFISAENLTTNETIDKQANCSEELIKCINLSKVNEELYFSLLEDYKNGINCGGVSFLMLKDMNKLLSEERDNCMNEIKKMKDYRIGFYILAVVLMVNALIILFKARKRKISKYNRGG